ncbi:exodeoxyribonuclease V subunit alpha [Shewanella gaetbuli]|uniref:RecBCD enzyme subunit RecD n=1 Tax=Shewanella gaetbuli TaxID=220752 RepID=A0A9X1ZIF3_9GAMM|nr:exodeoxyribonuclease V subunit alpha [Shewanella gaetbuli]MCL1142914.1 exodeoxyribonuclease V subunit alpha [Shewanella gaetbuli]
MLNHSQPIEALLKQWQQEKLLTPLDRHFALELTQIEARAGHFASPNPAENHQRQQLFLLICALLSQQLSNQHSCLVLDQIDLANPMAENVSTAPYSKLTQASCQIALDHQSLTKVLSEFNAIGQPGENTPIILDHNRLYLNKYYFFETQVAQKLTTLANTNIDIDSKDNVNAIKLPQYINALYPREINDPQFNWQKIATATALTKALAVITGGPGTGKTTTVTKLLLLLLTQKTLKIRLVAPTGKAAARLSESIKASKQRLLHSLTDTSMHNVSQEGTSLNSSDLQVLQDALHAIPEEASTLHRLLGVVPHSHQFRHNKDNPLRLDLLVIDEASMVDLPMMYKILSALPNNARLILLGDQDQLASVEAGAVLADICQGLKVATDSGWQMRYSAEQAATINRLTQDDVSEFIEPTNVQANHFGDSLCMLMHSHRFKGDAGIGQLAKAVNYSNIAKIRQVWRKDYQELHWFEHQISAQQDNLGKQALLTLSVAAYQPYLQMIQHNQQVFAQRQVNTAIYSAEQIIEQYNQYRMLCAMRASEYGVEGMNQAVTDSLRQAELIAPKQEFYLGRPIIIQSNDYNLGLFNGDIGLILQDSRNPRQLMAHFVQADGSLLKVLPARLPTHDTCFAMTVHKSQGSEFDQVSLVLPPKPSVSQWQLLTKELVYTAITRAKNHFYCLGSANVFEKAAKQVTQRSSGLAQRLWE